MGITSSSNVIVGKVPEDEDEDEVLDTAFYRSVDLKSRYKGIEFLITKNDYDRLKYYWHPTQGSRLPLNAAWAGVEWRGVDVFVGRAKHNGVMLPAKVVPRWGGAFVSSNHREHFKHDYQILVWNQIGWSSDQDGNVPLNALIIGRLNDGEFLFMGRVKFQKCLIPGKIQKSLGGCIITHKGKELLFTNYEVLVEY